MKVVSVRMKKDNEQLLNFKVVCEDNPDSIDYLLKNFVSICAGSFDGTCKTFSITAVVSDVVETEATRESE